MVYKTIIYKVIEKITRMIAKTIRTTIKVVATILAVIKQAQPHQTKTIMITAAKNTRTPTRTKFVTFVSCRL